MDTEYDRLLLEMEQYMIDNMPAGTITRSAPVMLSTVYNVDTLTPVQGVLSC